MRIGIIWLLILNSLYALSQDTSGISLQIIDANVCFNKKTSALNFSYYFENHSDKHMVIIDYYEPCPWEKQRHISDSAYIPGLVLRIKDDLGQLVLPTIVPDTAAMQHDLYIQDSLNYFEDYNKTRNKNYLFHTRSLRPKDVLVNLYNLRINKRKCFYKSVFTFDYSRKYTVSLYYLAKEDVHTLANYAVLNKDDVLFVGELISNEVSLCFK